MLNQKLLDEISKKVNDLVAQSPVKDVEKNLRVLLAGVFTRLDLVTRDEFDGSAAPYQSTWHIRTLMSPRR